MQCASNPIAPMSTITNTNNKSSVQPSKTATMVKLTISVLMASTLGLTGCQTIKGLTGNGEDAVASAAKSEAAYYKEAIESIDDGKYTYATEQLGELRTFYPTGVYAEQALLDLMYAQFKGKEYDLAAGSAEQFIKLYPRNPQVDYAYYVRGVSNMQAGNSALLNLAGLNQAHRDTAYLRLAFNNFQDLLSRYPNSPYVPDAAQRMNFIYNQFAESELAAARWYIKRDAYVASANRAKWVFQYYPLSPQVPEAIAILAFSNEQLGLNDLAQQYKTLLQINYPEWLTNDGRVKLNIKRTSGIINTLSFGYLGRADEQDDMPSMTTEYTGPTKEQTIQQAAQLQLPDDDSAEYSQASFASLNSGQRRGFNIGLGLPEPDAEQLTNQTNARPTTQSARLSPGILYRGAPITAQPEDQSEQSSTQTNDSRLNTAPVSEDDSSTVTPDQDTGYEQEDSDTTE